MDVDPLIDMRVDLSVDTRIDPSVDRGAKPRLLLQVPYPYIDAAAF